MTFADAVEAVVWLRDPQHAADMNAVFREIVKPTLQREPQYASLPFAHRP